MEVPPLRGTMKDILCYYSLLILQTRSNVLFLFLHTVCPYDLVSCHFYFTFHLHNLDYQVQKETSEYKIIKEQPLPCPQLVLNVK